MTAFTQNFTASVAPASSAPKSIAKAGTPMAGGLSFGDRCFNGGFEQDAAAIYNTNLSSSAQMPDGWTFNNFGEQTAQVYNGSDTTKAHSGNNSLVLAPVIGHLYVPSNFGAQALGKKVSVTAGQTITLSGYMSAQGSVLSWMTFDAHVRINFYNAAGTVFSLSDGGSVTQANLGSGWLQKIVSSAVVPAGAVQMAPSCELFLQNTSGSNQTPAAATFTVYFDDVSLTITNDVATSLPRAVGTRKTAALTSTGSAPKALATTKAATLFSTVRGPNIWNNSDFVTQSGGLPTLVRLFGQSNHTAMTFVTTMQSAATSGQPYGQFASDIAYSGGDSSRFGPVSSTVSTWPQYIAQGSSWVWSTYLKMDPTTQRFLFLNVIPNTSATVTPLLTLNQLNPTGSAASIADTNLTNLAPLSDSLGSASWTPTINFGAGVQSLGTNGPGGTVSWDAFGTGVPAQANFSFVSLPITVIPGQTITFSAWIDPSTTVAAALNIQNAANSSTLASVNVGSNYGVNSPGRISVSYAVPSGTTQVCIGVFSVGSTNCTHFSMSQPMLVTGSSAPAKYIASNQWRRYSYLVQPAATITALDRNGFYVSGYDGGANGFGANGMGQNGVSGLEFADINGLQTGSGGGGGGGNGPTSVADANMGGSGGCYGAGGGGGGYFITNANYTGGTGADGLLVFTYTSSGSGTKTIFITRTNLTTGATVTTYTVPSDYASLVSVEAIGAGAGGADNNGGGGGAYAKITTLTLAANQVVNVQIGRGGGVNSDGTDTWFKDTATLLAKAGLHAGGGPGAASGGLGGASTSCIGTTKFSGGTGGTGFTTGSGGGGGAAAGPNGAGQNGSAAVSGLSATDKNAGISLSNNNLTATRNATSGPPSWVSGRAVNGLSSGKWYWEYTVGANATTPATLMLGVCDSTASLATHIGNATLGWGYYGNGNSGTTGQILHNGGGSTYGATFAAGDKIGVALDMDGGTITFYKNGVSQGVAATGLSGTLYPAVSEFALNDAATVNFGGITYGSTAPAGYANVGVGAAGGTGDNGSGGIGGVGAPPSAGNVTFAAPQIERGLVATPYGAFYDVPHALGTSKAAILSFVGMNNKNIHPDPDATSPFMWGGNGGYSRSVAANGGSDGKHYTWIGSSSARLTIPVVVTAGKTYTYSAYIDKSGMTGTAMSIEFNSDTSGSTVTTLVSTNPPAGSVGRQSVSYTVPSGTSLIYAALRNSSDTGTVLVSEFQVEVGASATSYQPPLRPPVATNTVKSASLLPSMGLARPSVLIVPRSHIETFSTSDSVARILAATRTPSETLTTSDTIARILTALRALSQTNNLLVDACTGAALYRRGADEELFQEDLFDFRAIYVPTEPYVLKGDPEDLLMSQGWDLVPNWAGGLREANTTAIDLQDITYRVKVNDPEHYLWSLGANLEDLVGQPNTQATALQGQAQILRALTFDGRFNALDLEITAVPISQNQIKFYIRLKNASDGQSSSPVITTIVQL